MAFGKTYIVGMTWEELKTFDEKGIAILTELNAMGYSCFIYIM